MFTRFTETDIGDWVVYDDGHGAVERGKLKSFDNERRVAWVVFKANGNWDADHWKDYTAQCCNYKDIHI